MRFDRVFRNRDSQALQAGLMISVLAGSALAQQPPTAAEPQPDTGVARDNAPGDDQPDAQNR